MHNEPTTPQLPCEYKPSAGYWRRRIHALDSKPELRQAALDVVSEYERLREWVRTQGLIPPKWVVDGAEAEEKGWG